MKKSAVSIITLAALVYGGLCAYLFATQRSLIYFPTPEVDNPLAEEIRLDAGGATLKIWRLGAGSDHAVIYFGGNAEQVSMNTRDFLHLLPEFTVYLVNYRGYGGSTGSPAEAALYDDALAVYDQVADQHARISTIGRSLGSGVATYLATARDLERMVLVTPYDSIHRLAQASLPMFPVSLMLKDRFDSLARAGDIDVPTLLLVAENDGVIPARHSEALAAAIDPRLVEVVVVRSATHNTIQDVPEYGLALTRFLRSAPR